MGLLRFLWHHVWPHIWPSAVGCLVGQVITYLKLWTRIEAHHIAQTAQASWHIRRLEKQIAEALDEVTNRKAGP